MGRDPFARLLDLPMRERVPALVEFAHKEGFTLTRGYDPLASVQLKGLMALLLDERHRPDDQWWNPHDHELILNYGDRRYWLPCWIGGHPDQPVDMAWVGYLRRREGAAARAALITFWHFDLADWEHKLHEEVARWPAISSPRSCPSPTPSTGAAT